MSGNFLLIYICDFHVVNHLLLIYICKLHWNLNRDRKSSCKVRSSESSRTSDIHERSSTSEHVSFSTATFLVDKDTNHVYTSLGQLAVPGRDSIYANPPELKVISF